MVPNVPEVRRPYQAGVHFDGEAKTWFQTFSVENSDINWPMFVEGVCQRFGDIREETVVVDFTNWQQTGSLQEYVKKFEHYHNLSSLVYFVRG